MKGQRTLRIAAVLAVSLGLGWLATGPTRSSVPTLRWSVGGSHDPARPLFAEVEPWTALRVAVETPRPGHLYIASFEPTRGTIAMFPSEYLRTGAPGNPLPAGTTTLPGHNAGTDVLWHVGDVPGPLSIVAVFAEQPVVELEALWPRLRKMGNAAFPARELCGVYAPKGGMEVVPPRDTLPGAALRSAMALADPTADGPMVPWEGHPGVWLKTLRLSVPATPPAENDLQARIRAELGGVLVPGDREPPAPPRSR